jgi:hypothetical protein
MKRISIIALALLVAGALVLGGATKSSANPPPAGAPDTYVAAWDAVGSQAFTAAALTPAEGHTIFAYVAIAVYDSVMAIDGTYRPFAVKVHAPAGASAQAAVAAAAHDVLVHYLPAQAATIVDPAYVASLATIPDGQSKTDGVGVGQEAAAKLIALRANDGFRDPSYTYTPPNPPVPGKWIPTVGARLQRGQGDRFGDEFDADTRTDDRGALLGGSAGAAGARLVPEVRARPQAGRPGRVAVHGHDVGRLRGCPDRMLRREVHLRVLAADHRDPRG